MFKEILIRGPILDAVMVRSTIYACTYTNDLLCIPIQAIAAALTNRYGEDGARLLTATLGDSAEHHTIQTDIDLLSKECVIDLSDVEHTSSIFTMDANDVLDMSFYRSRIYLATESGLYSIRVPHTGSEDLDCKQHIQGDIWKVSADNRIIVASCGNNGLKVMFEQADAVFSSAPSDILHLAPYSVDADFSLGHIVNYPTREEVELFRMVASTPRQPISQISTTEIPAFEPAHSNYSALMDSMAEDYTRAEIVKMSASALVVLRDSKAFCWQLKTTKNQLRATNRQALQGNYNDRPIVVEPFGSKFIVETTDDFIFA